MKIIKSGNINRILFLSIFIIFINPIFSQNTIKGNIKNTKGKPVEFATIQLFVDSVFNQSALSDSLGNYTINSTKNGNCEMFVDILGYSSVKKGFILKNDTTINFILQADTTILDEVTITGQRKLIQSKPDRLIVNIAGNIETKGKETTQILKQLPSVNLSQQSLNIFGKSSVIVYINDRIVRLSGQTLISYLNSLPPDIIKSVEIITTPPAQYDAEGNVGIIKINTKKDILPGWKELLKAGFIQNSFSSYLLSAFASYNGKKVFFEGTISNGNYSYLNQSHYYSYFPDETITTFNPKKWNFAGSKINATLGYDFNKKSNIIADIQVPIYHNETISDIENQTDYINPINNQKDSTIYSNGKTVKNIYTYNSELFFKHKFSNTSSFTANIAYLNNSTSSKRAFSSITQINNTKSITENYNTEGNQNYNILTPKLDFSFPLFNCSINTGYKFSLINTKSNSNFFSVINGDNIIDSTLSNKYNYNEQINALYLSVNRNFKNWSFKAGVRSEMTNTLSKSLITNEQHKSNYIDFFPTLYITRKINNSNLISLSYSERIERPPYQYLDPFKWYITKYDYALGNPFLKPSYLKSFELNYLHNNTFNAKIYYTYQDDKIGQYVVLDSLNTTNQIQIADNFLNVNIYGLSIYKLLKFFDWQETVLQGNLSFSEYLSNKKEFSDISGINGIFTMNNTIFIKEKIQFLCNLEEKIPGLYDYRKMENSFELDLGFNYIINKKGLEARLYISDIFKTANPEYYYVSGGIKQIYKNYYDTRMLRLILVWKLGNWYNKTKKIYESANIEEKQRL